MHNADIYSVYMSVLQEVVNGAKYYNCFLSTETHALAWIQCVYVCITGSREWSEISQLLLGLIGITTVAYRQKHTHWHGRTMPQLDVASSMCIQYTDQVH